MKKQILVFLTSLLLLLTVPFPLYAAAPKTGEKVTVVPVGERINGDYFASGETVRIAGDVDGDVYAFGERVEISGSVSGDVIAAGGRVTISGNVFQDARVAGGEVELSGKVGRNATLAGGVISMTSTSQVLGNAIVGGGKVAADGQIDGNLKAGGGTVMVGGKVQKNVEVGSGDIRLEKGSFIGGDFLYWSDKDAFIDTESLISGTTVRNISPVTREKMAPIRTGVRKTAGVFHAMNFFSTLIVGLLLLTFFPNASKKTVAMLKEKPVASALIGLASLFLTPLLIIVLFVTLLGIPLAFFLIFAYFTALYLSRLVVAGFIGAKLSDWTGKRMSQKWEFFLGLLVYTLLTRLPIVGGIVGFLSVLVGLGALGLMKRTILMPHPTVKAKRK